MLHLTCGCVTKKRDIGVLTLQNIYKHYGSPGYASVSKVKWTFYYSIIVLETLVDFQWKSSGLHWTFYYLNTVLQIPVNSTGIPLESTGVHWKSTGTKVQWKMVESSGLPVEVQWKSSGLLELNLMNLLGL